jgi:hypothetical protein
MLAEVVDRSGRPIAGAHVTVGREAAESDEQGVVAMTVLPYVPARVEVKARDGGGVDEVRPLCGAGRVKLIVERQRLEVVTDSVRWSDLGVGRGK